MLRTTKMNRSLFRDSFCWSKTTNAISWFIFVVSYCTLHNPFVSLYANALNFVWIISIMKSLDIHFSEYSVYGVFALFS